MFLTRRHEEDARLKPKRHVFVEPASKIADALRFVKQVIGSDLALIVGALPDRNWAIPAQQSVGGAAIAKANELRLKKRVLQRRIGAGQATVN